LLASDTASDQARPLCRRNSPRIHGKRAVHRRLKRIQDALGRWHDWLTLTQSASENLGEMRDSSLVRKLHNVTGAKSPQCVAVLAKPSQAVPAPRDIPSGRVQSTAKPNPARQFRAGVNADLFLYPTPGSNSCVFLLQVLGLSQRTSPGFCLSKGKGRCSRFDDYSGAKAAQPTGEFLLGEAGRCLIRYPVRTRTLTASRGLVARPVRIIS